MDKSCKDTKEHFSTCEDLNQDDSGRHGNEGVGVRNCKERFGTATRIVFLGPGCIWEGESEAEKTQN